YCKRPKTLRTVDNASRRATGQNIEHGISSLLRLSGRSFLCVPRQMRCNNDVRHGEKWMLVCQRLARKYIQSGARNPTFLKGPHERGFINDCASRYVDQKGGRL